MAIAGNYVTVKLDDVGGTLRTFASGDIISVDLGTQYDQYDITGFGDDTSKVMNGQRRHPVTLRGYLTTTASTGTHTVLRDAFAQGKQVTLRVAVGNNAAPVVNTSPEYSGEFYVASYIPSIETGAAIKFVATLTPAVGSSTGTPAWGTMA